MEMLKKKKKTWKIHSYLLVKTVEKYGPFAALKLITISKEAIVKEKKKQVSSRTENMKMETVCGGGRRLHTAHIDFHSISFVHVYLSFNGALALTSWNALVVFGFVTIFFLFKCSAFALTVRAVICARWFGPEYRLSIELHWQRFSVPTYRPVLLPNCFRIVILFVYIRSN